MMHRLRLPAPGVGPNRGFLPCDAPGSCHSRYESGNKYHVNISAFPADALPQRERICVIVYGKIMLILCAYQPGFKLKGLDLEGNYAPSL